MDCLLFILLPLLKDHTSRGSYIYYQYLTIILAIIGTTINIVTILHMLKRIEIVGSAPMSTATIAIPVSPPGVVAKREVRKSILHSLENTHARPSVKMRREKLYAIAAGKYLGISAMEEKSLPLTRTYATRACDTHESQSILVSTPCA